MKEGISLFSTHAQDILIDKRNETTTRQPGGPILFLEQALKLSNVPYESFHGERIDVEILITHDGEFGKIPHKINPQPIPLDQMSDWTVVSTLLREWNLNNLVQYEGRAFVDLQGYVRNGDDFGKKQMWDEVQAYADFIYCLKGTKQEVEYLPDQVREAQKNRLLIATDGAKGLDLFYQGDNFHIPAVSIPHPKDTIGAGDTFFGYFVASMYKGSEPVQAAENASKLTAQFLQSK